MSAWERFVEALRDTLGPPLKSLLSPLDQALDRIPMAGAQACAIGLFVVAGIWVWMLPRKFVFLGAPDQSRWRDLRIWSTLVLLPYVVIYYWFGQ